MKLGLGVSCPMNILSLMYTDKFELTTQNIKWTTSQRHIRKVPTHTYNLTSPKQDNKLVMTGQDNGNLVDRNFVQKNQCIYSQHVHHRPGISSVRGQLGHFNFEKGTPIRKS